MDTLNPGLAWRKRGDQDVARKTYSEEFRRDAVELYRSTPGATVVGIAGDLGIMDSTLSGWLHPRPGRGSPPTPDGETPAAELARLRAGLGDDRCRGPWSR